ncbi:MAG: type II/IV secretion system protein [Planctomycetota bacterium]
MKRLRPGGQVPAGSGSDTAGALTEHNPILGDWSAAARLFKGLGLSAEQLEQFAQAEGSDEEPFDVMLALLGTDEQTALQAIAKHANLPFNAEPRIDDSASHFFERIPPDVAREHHVAALRTQTDKTPDGGQTRTVTLATAQPFQPALFESLEDRLDADLEIVLAPRGAVASLINRGYEARQDLVGEIIEEMPLDESAIATAAGSLAAGSNDLLALARQTPVIRLVNMILFEALRRRASDVHVHPEEEKLTIRFRVDGMLVDAFSPPLGLAAAISSRLKVMTELDIANRHAPQDGYTSVRIGSRKVDIRLSVIPTVYGERIVLRLLDQSSTELQLDQIGMSKDMQARLMDLIDRPNGMVLVTGPTGSGKTTTLYAALQKIDRNSRNVMTVEDPVEYHVPGISQMQVNPKRGVTFAAGLRALLRQDPDVILVGEVRDHETANLAVQASLTGHFVLATLHTNDAPGAIPRLIDMGLEHYLITSSLLGVLAQRLLRRVCPVCAGTGVVHEIPGESVPVSAGSQVGGRCENCFGSGYKGRLAVYELMKMTDRLRRLTAESADGVSLYEAAIEEGFEPMRVDAKAKVAQGITDESELFRVLH